MKKRVIVAVIFSLFHVCMLFIGKIPLLVYAAAGAFIATYEVAHVSAKRDYRPHTLPAYIFALAFPFVFYFLGIEPLFIFYAIAILTSMIGLVIRRPKEPNCAIISVYFFIYPLFLMMMIVLSCFYFEGHEYTTRSFSLILPFLVDTFALFGGRLFGKHKLAPDISPKKTIEGAISGLIFGTACGCLLIPLQKIWGGNLAWYLILITSFVISIVSQFGDLFASMFKRWAGVKDFSSLIPEHGGLMDRLDSMFFSSAATFILFDIFRLLGLL